MEIVEKPILLDWSECYNADIKDVSNKMYMEDMKRILTYLNVNTDKCDLRIFAQEETYDKIVYFLKDFQDTTKYKYYRDINIYLEKYLKLTSIKMDYDLYNKYIKKKLEYKKAKMINKKIPKFEDILIKIKEILKIKRLLTDLRIILIIYSYGFDDEKSNPIGILRHSDLLNTIYKTTETDIVDFNYIDIQKKKWFFLKNATKNSKDREINLDDKFLKELIKYKNSTKLLYDVKTHKTNLYRWLKSYGLPNLNTLRKSCEIYLNSGKFSKDKGEIITYNMGHTKEVANEYYNITQ